MTPKKGNRPLPAALAKNAAALAQGKKVRLRERGEELVALILQKRQEAASVFYEMGQYLRELSQKEVYLSMGHKSFCDLIESKLDMSVSRAAELKSVAEKLGQKFAIDLGITKSIAVASALDVPGIRLEGTTLHFVAPKLKQSAGVLKTSVKDIEALTKLVRHKNQRKSPPRGLTSSPAERARADSLQKGLHKSGAVQATVKCIATKPGHASDLLIRVSIDSLAALQKILSQMARQ